MLKHYCILFEVDGVVYKELKQQKTIFKQVRTGRLPVKCTNAE